MEVAAAVRTVSGALELLAVGPAVDGSDETVDLVVGAVSADPLGLHLPTLGMIFEHDGRLVETSAGAAILGHPLQALADAVRILARSSRQLESGTVVYVGRLVAPFNLQPGSVAVATFHRLGTVAFACPR
jgi:2-keto-4-pentenoate hydratase